MLHLQLTDVTDRPEDRRSMFLRNVGIYLQVYTALPLRIPLLILKLKFVKIKFMKSVCTAKKAP